MRRAFANVVRRLRPRAAIRAWTHERWFYLMAAIVVALPFIAMGWMISTQIGRADAPGNASGKALRVCASPNDLPFSNKARAGFENKLASRVGKALGEPVQYEWGKGAGLQQALAAHKCDAIMGWPTAGAGSVLTTKPYYRSTYVLVYRQSAPYKIHSLKSPVLKKLKIGVREIGTDWRALPGGAMLAKHGLEGSARPYPLHRKGHSSPSSDLIEAVADGDIDAAIAWGPPTAYFARRQSVKLTVVPLVHVHLREPTRYAISMAVRKDETSLRTKLDRFLTQHRSSIHALLASYNLPLLPLGGARNSSAAASQ